MFTSTTVPLRAWKRSVLALLALAVAVSAVIVPVPSADAAGYNTLSFPPHGDPWKVFGPNGTIMIDGVLAYDDQCSYDQGIKDFIYAATDVYIVPTGSASGKLTDVGGQGPNTVVAQSSGIFIDEIIGFTSPAGAIGGGAYDVVFDTCQDGFLTDGDTVFPAAIRVELPETLPPVSPSIATLKDKARQQYQSWLETHRILAALFAADKAKAILECVVAPNPGCMLNILAVMMDEGNLGARQGAYVQDLVGKLVMNVAKNHGAIWQDPPDPDFAQLPVLERPDANPLPTAEQPLFDAVAAVVPDLADEAAVSEALLHALERYQGAQAAGDGNWALVQARAVRDLSDVFQVLLTKSTAVTNLRDTIADHADEVTQNHAAGAAFANRVRTSGFSPDERRMLANQGLTTADIVAVEGSFVRAGLVIGYDAADVLARLDALVADRASMAAALAESASAWSDLVAELEAATGRFSPAADAGGPYTVAGGGALRLDATGSTAVDGATITDYEWDTDGDGAFDDVSGAQPEVQFETAGNRLISLRVTDDAGRQAVDHAHVDVTGGNASPTVQSASPAAAASVVVGDSVAFTVDSTDPEGAALTYSWSFDGQPVGDGDATFTFVPDVDDVGPHAITVVVSDGLTSGVVRAWRLAVTLPDADGDGWTATGDCDDTRVDVRPGMFERLGNDLDDDCDPSTPDAPPGGLTGDVRAWGYAKAVGTGTFTNQYTPAPVTSLSDVTLIETSHARMHAVLNTGEVRSWGHNFDGSLGDGTTIDRWTPVPVVGVGGTGTLSGVVDLASEGTHTVALQQDGSVVTWGANNNGQVGDGSTVAARHHPVRVLDASGTPITGVVDVEAGAASSFALLGDGTVLSWGTQYCTGDASQPPPTSNVAVPLTLLGDRVVEISAGSSLLLARKADGSVWSCGTDAEELDRGEMYPPLATSRTPMPMVSFGPGSDVIDVTAAASGGLALKSDGTLWAWGHNLNGLLAPIAAPQARVWSPTQVPLPDGIPVVAVDSDSSCHPLVQRADGTVLTWGCNNHGGAGIGSDTNPTTEIHELELSGRAIAVASSVWNGAALVRPEDDDVPRPAHWIEATATDATIEEGSGGTVDVVLSEPAPDDLTVSWAFEDGASGEATIPAGATTVAVPVPTQDDALDEEDEETAFHLLAVSHGVQVARRTAGITIADDDEPPVLHVEPVTVEEGNTSLTDVPVTVSLSGPSGKDVTVAWTAADGTATAPGDYAAASGQLTIPAGETQGVVHVAVHGDALAEPHETFEVVLDQSVAATIGTASAEIAVHDDEPMLVSVGSPTVAEGTGDATLATFTVSVAPSVEGVSVTVPWQVVAGTAEVSADVEAAAGDLVFTPGMTEQTVTVAIVADAEDEADESFRLVVGALSASDGRTVLPPDPTVAVIVDDDEPVEEPTEFEFDGFYEPIENRPAVNVMQAGRAVPVKFSLGGDYGLDIFEPGYPASARIDCSNDAAVDPVEETVAPGASALTYDPDSRTYHYVWQTQRVWKDQCRRLVLRFTDGTEATADFRFR